MAPPARRPQEDTESYMMHTRDTEESWRRVALRLLFLQDLARRQVVLTELKDLMLNTRVPHESTSTHPATLAVPRVEILMRQQLKLSKSLRHNVTPPDECAHRWLLPRGGRTKWFTCRMCGSRWPRTDNEYCFEDDSVTPGTRPMGR